jgi:transglutaminase-like putative cysteine protease
MTKESAIVVPIICALVVAIAPHTFGLPLWINAWCLVMWGYMLVRLKTRWPLPGAPVRYGLTFTGMIGLLLTYRVQIGADAFVGLLALMAAIKPFEMATHRHQMITVLLTYFIIITSLFRSESMFIVLYMFFSVFITTIALVRINAPEDRLQESVKLGGKILAQAIPLMALLFLLFPRLPGSLFGIQDKSLGRTGFSDRLSPGSVTRLARDHTPAFRAEFRGPAPLANQLYWKGVVFQKFDGETWTPQEMVQPSSPTLVSPGKNHTYTILLEPHNSTWLMALDRPVKGPAWALLTAGQVLKSQRPVKQKIQYTVTSLTRDSFRITKKNLTGADARGVAPGAEDYKADSTPPHISGQVLAKEMAASIISTAKAKNPRTRALARTLVKKTASPTEKIQALLAYFKENQFIYTLNPPRAHDHPIDFFLFESKIGYCEHFASAFAFMMNVLEIPARVVGGYLGGEHNPYGNYLTIRQSYAHAWVEIFHPKNGWVRVDPTMAVAPERMETNPDGSSTALQSSAGFFSFSKKLTFALDAANMRWEAWFTGYSYFEQKAFLEKLGLGKWTGIAGTPLVLALMALVVLAGFSGVLFWLFQIKRDRPDPVQQAYGLFCRRLDKLGLIKRLDQGAIDFAKISGKKRPDLQTTIMTITDLYVQLRFQKECPDTTLAKFKDRIKNFNPKPVPPPESTLSKDITH